MLLIAVFPTVSPLPVKIKMRCGEDRLCPPPEWGSSLGAGGWASLRTSLNSLGACQWQGGFPCRNLPALTPTPSDSQGLCVPSVGSHPGHCPSGGHDATLLALDLKELSHAGEIFLVGLGHLLLGCLWVHNLQALGREGRQDDGDGETTRPLTTPPTPCEQAKQ